MRREIINEFHNTRVRVIVPPQYDTWEDLYHALWADGGPAATRRLNRIRRALCSQTACTCYAHWRFAR